MSQCMQGTIAQPRFILQLPVKGSEEEGADLFSGYPGTGCMGTVQSCAREV